MYLLPNNEKMIIYRLFNVCCHLRLYGISYSSKSINLQFLSAFCVEWVAFSALILLVGRQEGHPACKKWGDGGDGHCLVRMEWHPARWSVCLPLLIFSCTIKSRSSLAPADLGGPGKRAVKRLWCVWCGLCRMMLAKSDARIVFVEPGCHDPSCSSPVLREERMKSVGWFAVVGESASSFRRCHSCHLKAKFHYAS